MGKQLFIYNPVSGAGKAEKFIISLKQGAREERESRNMVILRSSEPGEATSLAEFCSKNYPDGTIYSVGGDGTLNEVINGIDPNVKLGIIPAGSGNDFYRVYKQINGTKKINLGIVNERKFINIASLGIDAKIADTANRIKHSNNKSFAYPRAIIEEIIKYEPTTMKINNMELERTIFTVCNGKYYGNGFPMNPEYDLSDGFLNIVNAGKLNRRQIVILLLDILREKHLNSPRVMFSKEKNITVELDIPLLCNVDGEIFADTKFNFSVIEEGVTVTTDVPQYVKKAIKAIK